MTASVLVVDDDSEMSAFVSESLAVVGFTTLWAASSEEVVSNLKRFPVDVIVSDIHMSGADGVELLRRVKQRNPEIEIIMMTANPNAKLISDVRSMGAYGFLEKPFSLEQLRVAVKDAVASSQGRRRHWPSAAPRV